MRRRDEMDFTSSSKKIGMERQRRQQELRRRREKEQALADLARKEQEKLEVVAAQRREREAAEQEAARLAEAEENRRTGGIRFSTTLRAVPTARDGERITLPASVLETLTAKGALDATAALAFELSALDKSGKVMATTHAGVAEFVAEEGTVGIPPKTAFSLTKERGLKALEPRGDAADALRVAVKFVKLPGYDRSFVQLQPRGEGFHRQGEVVVNIDIKAVLERELTRHTAITKGDWLPIRHDHTTYELVVRDLQPADALTLIHTDLEVDIMPSEAAEAEMERKRQAEEEEQRKQREAEDKAQARAARAEALRASMSPEPDASVKDSLVVMVRLPTGSHVQRRLRRSDVMDRLFDVVDSEAAVSLGLDPEEYALEMNYPKRSFTRADAAGSSLAQCGLTGRREALFLRPLVSEPEIRTDPMELDQDLTARLAPLNVLSHDAQSRCVLR